MSEYTPALSQLEFAYQEAQERLCGTNPFVASAEFERAIAEVAKAAKVEALREAADEWTQSAWAKDMAPGNDRPSLILGTSQRAANFLRAVADRIEAGEGA